MKISYIFQGLAFATAIVSMILGIINNEAWLWQFNCAMWIIIAFVYEAANQRLTKRLKNLVEDLKNEIKKDGSHE